MKILITGSNGFIGKKLCLQLMEDGHDVVGVDIVPSAIDSPKASEHYKFIQLDLNNSDLPDLSALGIDVVVHLAITMRPGRADSFDKLLEGTHKVLNAVQNASTPFLLGMSSLSVLDFDAIPAGENINESVRRCSDLPSMGRYAALKSKQEEAFIDFATQHPSTKTIIIRPGLVYEGENISDAYAGIIKTSAALIVCNEGEVPLIEVGSLITGISKTVSTLNTLPKNTILHFVNDNLPTQAQYLRLLDSTKRMPHLCVKLHWRLFSVFIKCCFKVFKMFGLHAYLPDLLKPQAFATRLKPFKYDNQHARQLIGWLPHSDTLLK